MKSLPVTAYVVAFERVGDRTLRMTHRQYRLHVRWRFILALREIPYFQVVVAGELRPLWKQMGDIARDTYFFEDLPPTTEYVTAVNRLVSERMSCRVDGDAAPWLAQAIHVIVLGRPELTIEDLEVVRAVRRDLSIGVNTIGVAEVTQVPHPQDSSDDVAGATVVDQPYAAFDDWDELRRVAHVQLDELLDQVKRQYTEATSHHLNIRPSKLQQLSEANMRNLIAWLWPEIGARTMLKRDTRRRLLDDLGLDQVSRAKTRT